MHGSRISLRFGSNIYIKFESPLFWLSYFWVAHPPHFPVTMITQNSVPWFLKSKRWQIFYLYLPSSDLSLKDSVVSRGRRVCMYISLVLGLDGCVRGKVRNGRRNMTMTREGGQRFLELMRWGDRGFRC